MSDDISFQTWICPQCHYDHAQGGACAGLDPKEFTAAPEDKSYIAEQYRKLSARFDDALDVLRELQDVPCCKDAKYPGCRACAAIDFIVHANLERLVAKREKPVPDTDLLEQLKHAALELVWDVERCRSGHLSVHLIRTKVVVDLLATPEKDDKV